MRVNTTVKAENENTVASQRPVFLFRYYSKTDFCEYCSIPAAADCDFSSWDIPQNEKCPQCGEILFRKKGKNLLVCRNEKCSYKAEYTPDEK